MADDLSGSSRQQLVLAREPSASASKLDAVTDGTDDLVLADVAKTAPVVGAVAVETVSDPQPPAVAASATAPKPAEPTTTTTTTGTSPPPLPPIRTTSATFDATATVPAETPITSAASRSWSDAASPESTAIAPATQTELTVTITDPATAAGERLDPDTGLPMRADDALTPPKFDSGGTAASRAAQLLAVLRLRTAGMTARQSDALRAHLLDFYTCYQSLDTFQAATALHWHPELVDAVFDAVANNHKHPCMERVLALLVILSRHFTAMGGTAGVEPRVTKIVQVMRSQPGSAELIREGMRSLINYSQLNSAALVDAGLLDVAASAFNNCLHDVGCLTTTTWVLRNMTVTDGYRKNVCDRVGMLMVNALCSYSADAAMAEHACYALGNVALHPDTGSLFTGMGMATAVKAVMATHATKVTVQEAACWLLYNASFEQNAMKPMLRLGLEEPLINAIRNHGAHNKNIYEWSDVCIKRIRAAAHANTPQAIADRNANRALKEGFLMSRTVATKTGTKQYFVLQSSRLIGASHDKDPEIALELRLKDVVDVGWEGADQKSIKLTRRTKPLFLSSVAGDTKPLTEWFTEIKAAWRNAVCAVSETPAVPGQEKPHAFSFNFAQAETIAPADMEKVCQMIVLHAINSHPNYATAIFKCQQSHPTISVSDWFAVKLVKRLVRTFLDSADQLKTFKSDDGKDFYDLAKLKKHFEDLIEATLRTEMKDFDQNPQLEGAPAVSTRYEYCAKQGIRPTMEDRHIHIPYLDYLTGRDKKDDPVSYYAVYDGHGGINVAAYVETHLHVNVINHPDFEADPKKAIVETFMTTQAALKDYIERLYLSNTAGSTGVVIVVRGKKMYVAWVGDSMATLYTKKADVELVHPHKPGQASEKARIEKLGGFVNDENGIMRVNGIVAVSRAFGNFRHKVIIPEADIREFDITGDEEFIVLACDGLWDVMTPAQVRQFVKKYVAKNGKARSKGVSEALVDESLRLGSTDNVSVVFIEFYGWKGAKRT